MATINYNGMELEEFTSDKPVAFPKGTKAVCWDGDEIKDEKMVIAYVPYLRYRVLTLGADDCDGPSYMACALLPDPPKPRRATNRELSRWLAQGNGECLGSQDDADTAWNYPQECSDTDVREGAKVRKWSDNEWHEPTVEYMFGCDK